MMMSRITLSNFPLITTDLEGDHLGLRKYDDNPDLEKKYLPQIVKKYIS